MAETTARELGRLGLVDALELTALIALKDPRRKSRAAVRWLQRLGEERAVTIDECAMATAALAALGGPAHDAAVASLRALAGTASGNRR
jgi:hypothetical protein